MVKLVFLTIVLLVCFSILDAATRSKSELDRSSIKTTKSTLKPNSKQNTKNPNKVLKHVTDPEFEAEHNSDEHHHHDHHHHHDDDSHEQTKIPGFTIPNTHPSTVESVYSTIPNSIETSKVPFTDATHPQSSHNPVKPQCGISKWLGTEKRIINGDSSYPNIWPWVVYIATVNGESRPSFACTATLISEKHVLTSANCLNDYLNQDLIVIGEHYYLNSPLYEEDKYKIEKIIFHPEYNEKKNSAFDIILIELKQNVKISDKISPICLAKTRNYQSIFGKQALVAGWGKVGGQRDYSNNLLETYLDILNDYKQKNCSGMDHVKYCAIDKTETKSNICYGDYGGPLQVQEDDGRWYLYGIASYAQKLQGRPGCNHRRPSFFTSIPHTRSWIFMIINYKN